MEVTTRVHRTQFDMRRDADDIRARAMMTGAGIASIGSDANPIEDGASFSDLNLVARF